MINAVGKSEKGEEDRRCCHRPVRDVVLSDVIRKGLPEKTIVQNKCKLFEKRQSLYCKYFL